MYSLFTYTEKKFLGIPSFMFFSFNTLANNSLYDQKFPAASISSLCKNSLEWYDDHPGYVGEFDRVFDYCKEYVKDVSPEGLM